ncbi:hypothetical protein YC2023_023587 [Brassica napus]
MSVFSVEIGHGSVLMRNPHLFAREKEFKPSSLSSAEKRDDIGAVRDSESVRQVIKQEQLKRTKSQTRRVHVSGSLYSPLCSIDLKVSFKHLFHVLNICICKSRIKEFVTMAVKMIHHCRIFSALKKKTTKVLALENPDIGIMFGQRFMDIMMQEHSTKNTPQQIDNEYSSNYFTSLPIATSLRRSLVSESGNGMSDPEREALVSVGNVPAGTPIIQPLMDIRIHYNSINKTFHRN